MEADKSTPFKTHLQNFIKKYQIESRDRSKGWGPMFCNQAKYREFKAYWEQPLAQQGGKGEGREGKALHSVWDK